MRLRKSIILFLFVIIAFLFFYTVVTDDVILKREIEYESYDSESKEIDWFMLQRIYPYDNIDMQRFENARAKIRNIAAQKINTQIVWQNAGPTNIGGRITSLVIDPINTNIIYAGAASGGVWKSTDNTSTWINIFNESPSIGALALDPTNPSTVYVGTGEANPGGIAIYPGNGIWKSVDGGDNWTNVGLQNSGHIGKIAIHPAFPNRIFTAALGQYRGRTTERGIYRSTNAGLSWTRVLYMNDTTGACEVVIHPTNPNYILAAMWTRYRPLTYSIISGANSGLWLSTNAGDSWTQVTNGFPANNVNLGRISLAFSESNPNIVYALAANQTTAMGLYKSTDSGVSWSLAFNGSTFAEAQVWFNNVLAVHPADPNTIFAGMVQMWRSINGGTAFSNVISNMHVDQHAIAYDPTNHNRILVGNDGGVFYSSNGGTAWVKSYNLPITQFYAGTIDFSNPNRYYGGTQDNGTNRTMTGSSDDWSRIYGGDGFYVLVDPTNPNFIYAESQNGGLAYSRNGGTSFSSGRTGISSTDRTNWSTPFIMDPNNSLKLYVGTFRIYRTTNGMQSWTAISGDLTYGSNGRIGTITTIDVARSDSNVIYVGADDGRVSVTTNGGSTWQDISASLPLRWVTRVSVDPDSANVCYITHSGYLEYGFSAHVHKTTNFGQTWTNISGNLPDIPVNDIIIDPVYRPNLYIATDIGVMYSTNMGQNWFVLGSGLPEVTVHDLTLHAPTRKLTAFTHGRSAWFVDLTGLVGVQPIVTSINTNKGWNLISLPISLADQRSSVLFPTATSRMYEFNGTYSYVDSIKNGYGYWIKMDSSRIHTFAGGNIDSLSVAMKKGWNLVGGLNQNINVTEIITIPSGLIASKFFVYNGGYSESPVLEKGKGYWIKLSANGSVKLVSPLATGSNYTNLKSNYLNAIKIIDVKGNSTKLYLTDSFEADQFIELPPRPPSGSFDVRFINDKFVGLLSDVNIMNINYVVYPVQLIFEGDENIRLHLTSDDAQEKLDQYLSVHSPVYITRTLSWIKITNMSLPTEFVLNQNYPNPFNPTTTIAFDIPVQTKVVMRVYNILGQEVATLVNEEHKAGRYEVKFNGSLLSSGVYFYRITTGAGFSQTKKLLLLK